MQYLDFETLFEMKPSPKTVVTYAPGTKLDEPSGLSLSMVASPQCPLPFHLAKSL
jgi:hypothetical protein